MVEDDETREAEDAAFAGKDRTFTFVVNLDTGRPCCALLQAAFGGDHSGVSYVYPSEMWETFPGKRLKKLTGTAEQFREFTRLVSSGELKP